MVLKLQIKVFVIWTTLWLSVRGSGTDRDLICSGEGLLPSAVAWAKHVSNKSLHNETIDVQNRTKPAILNMTAEHFGRYICRAQHQNSNLTEVDITVIYVKKPEVSFNTTTTAVKPAGALNLTCMAHSLHPSVTTRTQINRVLQNDSRSVTVTIQDERANYSGPYTCTSKPMTNTGDNDGVNTTVNSISKPEITGQTAVQEGERLNLTCSAEGLPFLITWSKVGSTKNLSGRTDSRVKNSATLVISNVTEEDSGQYMCRADHLNTSVTADVNVTVNSYKILNSSGCTYQLETLTCMCISQGDPLPAIKWPLLDKHSSYIIIITVVNNTINSTIILSEKDHNNTTTVQCVLSNAYWEVKRQLLTKRKEKEEKEEDQNMKILRRIMRLEVILTFLVGILLSACICCLTRKCCRRKQKHSGYLAETLEMMTSQQDPLVESAEEHDHPHPHPHPEGEAEDAEKSDVEYSNINISVLPRNDSMAAEHVQNTTNTEYSEIKKQKRREERHEGEEEEMIGEEETHHRPTEEDDEEAELYSSVKDVMDQM